MAWVSAMAQCIARRIDEVRLRAVTASAALTGDEARFSVLAPAVHQGLRLKLPLPPRGAGHASIKLAHAELSLAATVMAPIAVGLVPLWLFPAGWRGLSTTPIGASLWNAFTSALRVPTAAMQAAIAMGIATATALPATSAGVRIASAAGLAFAMPGQCWSWQGKAGQQ
jgi:hypothetical protein